MSVKEKVLKMMHQYFLHLQPTLSTEERQQWVNEIEKISQMTDQEVETYSERLRQDNPHVCDSCALFNGNLGEIRHDIIGKCRNPNSPYRNREVNEQFTCRFWQ